MVECVWAKISDLSSAAGRGAKLHQHIYDITPISSRSQG